MTTVDAAIVNAPVELVLPSLLYDDWISDHLPRFQQLNRIQHGGNLRIDLAACEWVSPFPLLAIATEVMSFSRSGRSIEIDLGTGAGTDKGAQFRLRSLKYLALHGFLNTFATRPDLDVRFQFDRTAEKGEPGNWYGDADGLRVLRALLEKSQSELIYGDSIVLPATVWRLPDSDDPHLTEIVRRKVSELLKHADTVLFKFKTESRKYRDVTLQRLNQVLLELVENAAEHAYPEGVRGYVGLYARVRNTNTDIAIESRSREIMRSPLLGKILLSAAQQQIELFVVDVGCGLFSQMAHWKAGDLGAFADQPLRQTASVLFLRPLSRHNRQIETVSQLRGGSTGLVHLDSILRHQNDSTRIVTGKEWLAGKHPRPPGFQDHAVTTGGHIVQTDPIAGTFFHLGISPSVIPELNVHWFSPEKSSNNSTRLSIIRKFAAAKPRAKLETKVIDVRNGEGLDSIQDRVQLISSKLGGTIVRVNRIAEKNLINQVVVAWIKASARSNRSLSTLFLCDLGRYQAIDTLWVIEHLFSPHQRLELESIPGELAIFLVTEDMCCTALPVRCKLRRDGKFQVQIGKPTADISKLDNRLVYLLEELRIRDSIALWARAMALTEGEMPNPVMLADVLWPTRGADHILPFYLNFAVLIQDEDAARSIRRSLRRLLSLFPHAQGIALDALVGASLHDAMKWLILPPKYSMERVLVGTLSVSGSTLARVRLPNRTSVVGVVDCIMTPYFKKVGSDAVPHLAALLWDPKLDTTTENPPKYRRVGRSAFVEAIGASPRSMHYDEPLYSELESARLMKVGHWAHGECHGLLEINVQIAIEQSGASESGAITWMVAELAELCQASPVVLAFPVEKLAYRLAHHIKSRLGRLDIAAGGGLTLLPLSFMPRFAGGLSRFAPLVLDAAKGLAKSVGGRRPVAVFLDFGFITNRTARHSVRQLTDAGFEKIRAIGLLNRSSAPELSSENQPTPDAAAVFPLAYWRWNVPVLGNGTHCSLCAATPALGRLGQVVTDTHIDLVTVLKEINEAWAVHEISDSWEEYGLTPLPLGDALQVAIAPLLEKMGIANVHSSSALAARTVEYLRATGDAEVPLRLARCLVDHHGHEHAVELLCIIVFLAGNGFAATDLHDCVELLAKAAIRLGSGKQSISTSTSRQTSLLGLAVMVFATQSVTCKLAVLQELRVELELVDIVDSPALRLALISLTTDSDVSNDVQNEFERICTADRSNTALLHNYQSLRPSRGTAPESWDKLTQAFGRSKEHSQQSELGQLKSDFIRYSTTAITLPRLNRLASLLAQCDQGFVMNTLGIDPHEVIDRISALEVLIKTSDFSAIEFQLALQRTFGDISVKLHDTLVRYGDGDRSPNLIYGAFSTMIEYQASINGLTVLKDLVPTLKTRVELWPDGIGDYLPLGEQIGRLFGEIFSNIRGKSVWLAPPADPDFEGLAPALGWFWFDQTNEPVSKGITVVVVTGLMPDKVIAPFHPKVTGLADFNVDVSSKILADNYFEIRVRLPSLASILEMT